MGRRKRGATARRMSPPTRTRQSHAATARPAAPAAHFTPARTAGQTATPAAALAAKLDRLAPQELLHGLGACVLRKLNRVDQAVAQTRAAPARTSAPRAVPRTCASARSPNPPPARRTRPAPTAPPRAPLPAGPAPRPAARPARPPCRRPRATTCPPAVPANPPVGIGDSAKHHKSWRTPLLNSQSADIVARRSRLQDARSVRSATSLRALSKAVGHCKSGSKLRALQTLRAAGLQ